MQNKAPYNSQLKTEISAQGQFSFKNVMTFYPLGSVDLGKVHSSSVPIYRLVIPILHSLHTPPNFLATKALFILVHK